MNFSVSRFIEENRIILVKKGLTETEKNLTEKFYICNEVLQKEMCIICYEYLKEDELMIKIECNHYYHKKCIFDWCKIKPTCPICKRNFRLDIMRKYKKYCVVSD